MAAKKKKTLSSCRMMGLARASARARLTVVSLVFTSRQSERRACACSMSSPAVCAGGQQPRWGGCVVPQRDAARPAARSVCRHSDTGGGSSVTHARGTNTHTPSSFGAERRTTPRGGGGGSSLRVRGDARRRRVRRQQRRERRQQRRVAHAAARLDRAARVRTEPTNHQPPTRLAMSRRDARWRRLLAVVVAETPGSARPSEAPGSRGRVVRARRRPGLLVPWRGGGDGGRGGPAARRPREPGRRLLVT